MAEISLGIHSVSARSPGGADAEVSWPRRVAFLTAGLAGGTGVVILVGWLFPVSVPLGAKPGEPAMVPTTALSCLLTAVAVAALAVTPADAAGRRAKGLRYLAAVLATLVMLFAFLRLLAHAIGWDPQLDLLGMAPPPAFAIAPPRWAMAEATALSFAVLGLVILLSLRRRFTVWTQLLCLIPLAAGWLRLSQYASGGEPVHPVFRVAIPTAAALLALGVGTLCLRRDGGLVALFCSKGHGGEAARRLLPVAICGPTVITLLRVRGEHAGWFGVEAGATLATLGHVLLLGTATWIVARHLEFSETKRAAAEESARVHLREVADLRRALDEHAIVAMTDPRGKIIFVNDKFCEISGYSRDELLGQDHRRINSGHHPPEFFRELWSTIGRGEVWQGDICNRRKDGRRYWVATTIVPSRDAGGRICRYVGIRADITARKEAEELLRDERWRLQQIIEGTNAGTWEWNVQTGATVFNERWARIVGWTLAELAPTSIETWKTLAHPDDLAESGRQLARHFAGELDYYETVCRMRHRAGHWIWVADRGRVVTRTAAGEPLLMFGTHIEITAQVEAETVRREAETKFRQIAENIHEVFWVYEIAARRLVYVSPAFDSIWGRPATDLGESAAGWDRFVHPEDRARYAAAFGGLSERGGFNETYRILRPDGAVRWIHDQSFPVRDTSGRLVRVVGTAEDLTAAHELEEQLRQSQKLEAIGTLAGGIAHDFNNVLSGINGFTSLARSRVHGDAETLDYLAEIASASGRAAELVRQIMAFSRHGSEAFTPLQLGPVVAESLRLLRASLPSTIEFAVRLAPKVPPVLGNASQIHQVLMNLGTNAWHAMREHGGRLTVELSVVPPGAENRTPSSVTMVRLKVADTGCGMDAATRQRIFEPFFTTKPPGEGTGLGLSVVHGIVSAHHGTIAVESTPGEGTVFSICLPASSVAPAAKTKASEPMPHGMGERVLFVDDEESLVRLGVKALKTLGYETRGISDPLAALETLRADPTAFDVVVSDQTMPGLTGLRLAERLHEFRADLPVVLASGYSTELSAERIRQGGVRSFLPKPITIDALARAVREALDDSHGHPDANDPHH